MRNMESKADIIAISGCSSSGKTTLARLLRDLLPFSFILHQDDFYREEEKLPLKYGLRDWDCVEALDIMAMKTALNHIRTAGTFPPMVDSKEDQNSVGACPVSDEVLTKAKVQVDAWLKTPAGKKCITSGRRVCFFDGFLLFTPELSAIFPLMDLKLFLRVSRANAIQRRENRDGYVTLEGFWTDPPGYVENIVWPNYVETHKWLFQDGDVEGEMKADVIEQEKIKVRAEGDMEKTLLWAVDELIKFLEARVA